MGNGAFVFVGGHSFSVAGVRLCWWAVMFAQGRAFSWAIMFIRGPSYICGGGSWWPFASTCCWRAVLLYLHVVIVPVSWRCEMGMEKGHVLTSLNSDNGMHCHCLDDMAHLPHRLHYPSDDVTVPRCCCIVRVSWGL